MARHFLVSVEAMMLRLEHLGMIHRGTWNRLRDRGFKVREAQEQLGLAQPAAAERALPAHYEFLAVRAFQSGEISEGELARYLRTDRVNARRAVERLTNVSYLLEIGELASLPIDMSRDLLGNDGLIEVLWLDSSDEVATFVDFAITIDDGEAITATRARHRDPALASDDRKARRVIAERAPTPQLVSTLDLLHDWAGLAQVPDNELRRVMEAMRSGASFVPGPGNPRFEWWRDIMQRRS